MDTSIERTASPRRYRASLPAGPADTEAKILLSLSDPAQRELAVAERCKKIGIGRTTWYEHVNDPLFWARAHAAWRDCVHEDMGKVLAVLVQSALMPGREGHADRKVYLEMMRMYQPAASAHIEVKAEARASAGDLSDEQLLEMFRGNEQHLPPGVQRRLEAKGMVAVDEARG